MATGGYCGYCELDVLGEKDEEADGPGRRSRERSEPAVGAK